MQSYSDPSEELFGEILARGQHYDIAKIRTAYEFAKAAHGDQRRKSGEPYIIHPVAVAKIMLSFDCDTDTIVAALFHDIVEDTDVTLETVKREFGDDVALIVDGVTKLGRIQYSSKEEQQLETLRKMLLAMSKDIRVILIKLADRLHNMRTIDSLPPKKQREKALESIEVYAPLAHRLGLQIVKEELEDLSVKYLDPIGYEEIMEDLKKTEGKSFYFEEVRSIILQKLDEAGIKGEVEYRMKHIYSIYRKMFTQNKTFDEIYDLHAFRIIVDKVSDCYNMLGYIHDAFNAIPGRLKDYIATPKPNMYQSLHTTCSYKGLFFEIQIRTFEMHRIAEMGIAAHWKYKDGVVGDNETDSKLGWVRKLLEIQDDTTETDDFMKTFKIDLFGDQVFVSTPKGDIIKLSSDSTVIDFAYAIHTAVGNRMIGAKVNGRMVELSTTLKNGDVVEIITSNASNGPSRDWLNIAQTNEARSKIRNWFKKEKREENITEGRDSLERELRRLYVNIPDEDREEFFAPYMKKYAISTLDDFYAALGYGGISLSKILPKIRDDYQALAKKSEPPKVVDPKKRRSINGVIVEGIDNCLVKLSACCHPLPGDEIVGFISRGKGVSVHKKSCSNIRNVPPERLINVSWDGDTGDYFSSSLVVIAVSRFDLMADLTMLLAQMRIVLHSISAKDMGDGCTQVYLNVDVHDISHIDLICKRIKKLTNIIDARRVGDQE